MTFAQGGIVEGTGKIIRKNGEVVEFELKSDPLTQEQADILNQQEEDQDGRNTPSSG